MLQGRGRTLLPLPEVPAYVFFADHWIKLLRPQHPLGPHHGAYVFREDKAVTFTNFCCAEISSWAEGVVVPQ